MFCLEYLRENAYSPKFGVCLRCRTLGLKSLGLQDPRVVVSRAGDARAEKLLGGLRTAARQTCLPASSSSC